MRSIESDGDSIDQAIENALRALQVEREQVEIEILEDATRGLFGFGGRKARVRATVRAPLAGGLDQVTDQGAVSRGTRAEPEDRREPTMRPPRRAIEPRRPSAAPRRAATPSGTAELTGPVPEEILERCRALASELLALIGVSCAVHVRAGSQAGELVLDLTGDSGGLLIGRRGQTLDSLEYLINRMVGRPDEANSPRVLVDVEGYRERRRSYLDTLARRLAEKARHTGRVVTLNPMSPRDRRIVHLALQDDQTVATRSQGDGYYRRVLILPADRAQRGPRSGGSQR